MGYGKTLFCVMNGLLRQIKIFFEKLGQEQTRKFFETAKTTSRRITEKPTLLMPAYILMRITPHMHLGIVPMRNGKLSSKVMFNREELKHIQEDLPRYMNEHGFELQRGKRDSKEQHLSVADYKEKWGVKLLIRNC